ncbi:hypothetical protein [Agrobacterium pusense]|uniref:hypothetical protein n=1 Tax=Agrobacterium pusense TaxID=648995 RepID=UPI00312C9477
MTLPERLAHLPDKKRRELERAAQILFGEFEDSLKTKLSEKGRRGRILKLILGLEAMRAVIGSRIARAAIAPTMICSSSSISTALPNNMRHGKRPLNGSCKN